MTAIEAQWVPVKHLILGEDPQLRVFAEVMAWFNNVRLFRRQEGQQMFLHEPTDEDLAIHKDLIQRLIVDGQHLLSVVRQVGWPENNLGIAPEAVAADVEDLCATFRGWHEPMPQEERERLLKEIFPDVAQSSDEHTARN